MNILLRINNLDDIYLNDETNKNYINLVLRNYKLVNIVYDVKQNKTIYYMNDSSKAENFITLLGYSCSLSYSNNDSCFNLAIYDADTQLFVISFSHDKPDYDVYLTSRENEILNYCDNLYPNIVGLIELIIIKYFLD
jgi:hypothetical protein